MTEDIRGLITKIQQEGIKVGQAQAEEIERQARQKGEALITEAKKQAEQLITQAKDEVTKMEQNSRASLQQAARDLLLALREQINALLKQLTLAQLRLALTPQEMSKIIAGLIKQLGKTPEGEIVVALNAEDLKKLEQGLMDELSGEIKKGITLRPSREISAGFTISYDSGKSHYDFTDQGISEYLSSYLEPQLSQILKEAANPKWIKH